MPLLPTGGPKRPGLLGPPPQPAVGPPGLSPPPGPPMADPGALAGGGPPAPPGGGPLGAQPSLAGPLQGSQYPSTDPSAVSGLLAPLAAAQAQDQQQLQGQQMEASVLALIDLMKNQPNPAAQAAMTEPGYPTPPPPSGLA